MYDKQALVKIPPMPGAWGESSGASAMSVAFSAFSSHGFSSFTLSMFQNRRNQTVNYHFEMFSRQVCCPPCDPVLPPQQSVQRDQRADIPGM